MWRRVRTLITSARACSERAAPSNPPQQAILQILVPKLGGFQICRPHARSCIHALPFVPSQLTCVHVIGRTGEECDCDISPRCSRARAAPVVECVSGQALQRGPFSVASRALWSRDYGLQTRCLCVLSYGVGSVPRVASLPPRTLKRVQPPIPYDVPPIRWKPQRVLCL